VVSLKAPRIWSRNTGIQTRRIETICTSHKVINDRDICPLFKVVLYFSVLLQTVARGGARNHLVRSCELLPSLLSTQATICCPHPCSSLPCPVVLNRNIPPEPQHITISRHSLLSTSRHLRDDDDTIRGTSRSPVRLTLSSSRTIFTDYFECDLSSVLSSCRAD